MTYRNVIKLMTRSLVQDMVTCLNIFPTKNGIFNDLSPVAIILGSPNPHCHNLKIAFGAYSKLYIGTINSTKHRTVGSISLIPEN